MAEIHQMIPTVSIIVCSRNRCQSLLKTLESISRLDGLQKLQTELIVVDNGSTDGTDLMLSQAEKLFCDLRYIHLTEPSKGKSKALNLAVANASGCVLLFTDDDVRVPTDWLQRMAEPILSGNADAVAGGVRLADEVKKTGLRLEHRRWLASTEDLPRDESHPLIGANMSVSRKVFEHVPLFDPEVGPGGVGHSEDTLFWLQLREAGFKIITALDVEVIHDVDPSRISWPAFAALAEKRGEFAAYVDHHFNHITRRHPYLGLTHAFLTLWWARFIHPRSFRRTALMPEWEMKLLERYHERRRINIERHRPRNYEKFGLIKRGSSSERAHVPVK